MSDGTVVSRGGGQTTAFRQRAEGGDQSGPNDVMVQSWSRLAADSQNTKAVQGFVVCTSGVESGLCIWPW